MKLPPLQIRLWLAGVLALSMPSCMVTPTQAEVFSAGLRVAAYYVQQHSSK